MLLLSTVFSAQLNIDDKYKFKISVTVALFSGITLGYINIAKYFIYNLLPAN